MKKYFAKEDGQGIVEYGLIIALVAIVSVSSLGIFSGGLGDKYDAFTNVLVTEQQADGSYVITMEDGFGFFKENLPWGRLTGGDIGDEKDITIPSSMNGTAIKGIYQEAFRDKGLTQVIFDAGSSLVQIHARAFQGNELSSISLPNGLQLIDGRAFYNNNLTEITLPNSVQKVEKDAFGGSNNIQKVTIGANVNITENSIANKVFYDAYKAGGAGTYTNVNGKWVKQ